MYSLTGLKVSDQKMLETKGNLRYSGSVQAAKRSKNEEIINTVSKKRKPCKFIVLVKTCFGRDNA
jgi:hypothetical protein